MKNLLVLISLLFLLTTSLSKAAFRDHLPFPYHHKFSEICAALYIDEERLGDYLTPTTQQINLWLTLGDILRHGDYEARSMACCLYARITTHEAHSLKTKSIAYLSMAKIRLAECDYDFSFQFGEQALLSDPTSGEIKIWQASHPYLYENKKRQIELLLSACKTPDSLIKAKALIVLGDIRYTTTDNLPKDCYLDALSLLGSTHHHRLRAQCLIGLGDLQFETKRTPDYRQYYKDALKLLQGHEDIVLQAHACIGLGNARVSPSSELSYLDYYFEAVSLLKDHPLHRQLLAKVYIEIGNSGYINPQNNDPRYFYIAACNVLEEGDDADLFAHAFHGLAKIEDKLGNADHALYYYNLFIKYAPRTNALLNMASRAYTPLTKDY